MLKVNVLMSTYNGEKYIEEQIDSVLNQTGVEVSLYIRDDGSNDNTISIINRYIENNNNIRLYTGGNLGPAMSFLDLCNKTEEADYYAFCDQDDIWDADKLSIAVSMLEKLDQTKPNMYYSNLRLVDSEGNYYKDAHETPAIHKDRYMALIYNVATGCTMVFNKTCLEYVTREKPKKIFMHDYWVYLICKLLGNTVYDSSSHISYRQHGNNVCGMALTSRKKTIASFLKLCYKYALEKRNENLEDTLTSFCECYSKELRTKDIEKIKEIVHYRDSMRNRMILLLDKEIHHCNVKADINYRRRIIQGTLQI